MIKTALINAPFFRNKYQEYIHEITHVDDFKSLITTLKNNETTNTLINNVSLGFSDINRLHTYIIHATDEEIALLLTFGIEKFNMMRPYKEGIINETTP